MKIYLVGGAVRDQLLGLPIKERDWVVVGATVADMLKLKFRQVGKEFPVFLHPETHEEYALARMERKVNLGYKGFTFDTSPEVTLEDDLIRRDLTINAMAQTETGKLIDPYHGEKDLQKKILRHVSEAFIEDPVRILRVGRFLARYAHLGFTVAPETLALMQQMVMRGEVNALVAERVWKELERALSEKNPEKFFEVLAACQALPILFPELSIEGNGLNALQKASEMTNDPAIRFAALLYDLPEVGTGDPREIINYLGNRYRIPNAFRELALLVASHYQAAFAAKTYSAESLVNLFSALDIYRREDRFKKFLTSCAAIAKSKEILFTPSWLLDCAAIAKSIDVSALVDKNLPNDQFALALKKEREAKIAAWLKQNI